MSKTKTEDEIDAFKEEVVKEFQTIEAVGPATAEKLFEGGFYSILDIGASAPSTLSDRTSIGIESAGKIIANAMKIADLGEFSTGLELYNADEDKNRLSSGSEALDNLLGGGFVTGNITEMSALNGIGKTQLAYTLSVMATRPYEEGGLDTHVIFIDTENTYKPGRMYMIAEARGYDPEETLSKVHVIQANNSAHQILIMEKVRRLSAELGGVRLIVVDSVIAHFRSEFIGRGVLSDRQGKLGTHLSDLLNFARRNDAVIYVTNQIQSKPDAFFGNPYTATGGNVMGHFNAYRLYMRGGKAGKRVIRLDKAPDRPVGECIVELTEKGVSDA